jgi:hypothetical protein
MPYSKAIPITAEEARSLFDYSTETGIVAWASGAHSARRAGKPAGCMDGKGYITISVRGRRYLGHRLAWLIVNGNWPTGEIDHKNGVRCDNRLSNLRECSHAENQQNRARNQNSTSGHAGVYWNKHKNRWQAQIQVGGRRRFLGRFKAAEEASLAYAEAKRLMHHFEPTVRAEG